MRFPLLAKLGALVLVGLMLLCALMRIEGLVSERKARGEEAVRGVEHSHAAAQGVVGPVLERACSESWEVATGTGSSRAVHTETRAFTLQLVPTRLVVDGRTRADPLWRGLFKVNAYGAHFAVGADFASLAPLQPRPEHADGRLQCAPPVALLALSDVRGVRSAALSADGQALAVEPGTPNPAYPHGLHASLAPVRVDADMGARPLSLHLELDLVGTSQLAWVPAAGSTRWTLVSDWPHPSFGGQFSPTQREVRADGFSATWTLSSLATTAPSDLAAGQGLCLPANLIADAVDDGGAKPDKCLDLMAVAFVDPVNPYVLSDRATKYDLLFIALTFVAVGLVEVLSGRRVHPVQYLLVGLALSLFFLLLLSLSEHMAFARAYGVAAAACAGLLGVYASSMLGRARAGLLFGLGIALLYGLLYALLQLEQNALVIGSVMLFAALSAVMLLTRRIDWYALFGRLRASAADATAVPEAQA